MNDDDFSDPIESELRRRFDAASPRPAGDADTALDDLRPQLRRARTRHRAALAGMAAGAVALVAVAGFALTGGSSNPHVTTPPASHSSVPEPGVSTPTVPTMPNGDGLKESGTNGGGAFNGTNQTGGAADPGTSDSSGVSDSSEASSTTVPVSPRTQTFSSSGGSITVTLANASLSLTSTSPAAGQYAQITKNEAGIVEVEFYARPDFSGGRTSRIRVELVNGTMSPTID